MNCLATIRAKSKARYTCQECGSSELIQGHHEIPGDDDSIIALCAEDHSKKHPKIPKGLFFSINKQPYWHNKSAASLAREIRVHSRTIIRAARKLGILKGELSSGDEVLIKNLVRSAPSGCRTAPKVCQALGLSRFQLNLRVERKILPAPTLTDKDSGIRYFNDKWLRVATAILNESAQLW